MELPHAVYFYTLAQIGITFSGFATMLAVSWNLFGFFVQFAESVNFFFGSDEGEGA